MAISEGDIQNELDKIVAVLGAAKNIETLIRGVQKALADDDPIWKIINLTAAQKTALLAEYDALKLTFKALAAAY